VTGDQRTSVGNMITFARDESILMMDGSTKQRPLTNEEIKAIIDNGFNIPVWSKKKKFFFFYSF